MRTRLSSSICAGRPSSSQHHNARTYPFSFSGRREFSMTLTRSTHYETLSVPQGATKSQIKSNFYKLSKQFHPDVNKDPAARERFHKCSEAYAVLSDDRNRRAYDRTLVSPSPHSRRAGTAHSAESPYGHPHWSYANRHRGATHAWENTRRQQTRHQAQQHPYQYQSHSPWAHPAQQQGRDPFSSPHVRRATGMHQNFTRGRPEQTDQDRVQNSSQIWRVMQVTGIVLLVSMVGGGWSANA
ncbi:DnaJ-domain-containing protein [Stereum hirsutum FP-91666 SS1]|uniref:DnaJ-domain-containing protein n=1 Tax=Stereum hirsutum (strain FP-91666) TaxID=721885 RepID=UPI00044101F4|nr:DnaJ-domain-containing protein [Stereum hirsutum FP-91666 SS1]EIM87556.1 DnaJ-domain-containing protein [Stereum hirsutum FP-91666 SS1]